MHNPIRHEAKLAHTDSRCVVVYMQLPNRETHALVVQTDTLPPRFQQAVVDILRSPEGQADETFANVLHRRQLPDTGQNVLEALHQGGHLQPVQVEQVIMLPRPNQPVPLKEILVGLGRYVDPIVDSMTGEEKFNPHLYNAKTETSEDRLKIAQNLLYQADMIVRDANADAQRYRERAYGYAPELRPALTPMAPEAPSAPQPAVRKTAKSDVATKQPKAKKTRKIVTE